MISLPNGCRCSEIKVSPANWNSAGGNTKKPWRVHYRFYDPTVRDAAGKVKPLQVILKSNINYIANLQQRRDAAKALMADELFKLQHLSYNPFTGYIDKPEEYDYEIHPETPLIEALEKAKEKLQDKVVKDMYRDIGYAMKTIAKAGAMLQYERLSVSATQRRHLIRLLEQCGKINPRWSARRHNMYRSYLIMMFKVLQSLEAAGDINWSLVEIRKQVKKIKITLTPEQRQAVKAHLSKVHPRFLHFVNVFYHSGGRITEVLQQNTGTINLEKQTYRAVVKKGRQWVEVERTIKDAALPHWQVFLEGATMGQYLFCRGFKPGLKPFTPKRITDLWRKKVKWPPEKGGLGIDVDFYKLKHLHTTEIVDLMGSQDEGTKIAAEHNAHTGTGMVVNIYDTRRQDRTHDKLKRLGNEF